jgi:hypothetical protein
LPGFGGSGRTGFNLTPCRIDAKTSSGELVGGGADFSFGGFVGVSVKGGGNGESDKGGARGVSVKGGANGVSVKGGAKGVSEEVVEVVVGGRGGGGGLAFL